MVHFCEMNHFCEIALFFWMAAPNFACWMPVLNSASLMSWLNSAFWVSGEPGDSSVR